MSVDLSNILQTFFNFIFLIFELILFKVLKALVPRSPKNISRQVALVTGSAQGLGCELAKCLAAEGCNLALADINDEKNKIVAKEISENFPEIKVKTFHVDVSKSEQIENLKSDIKSTLGYVDILINNAAVIDLKNSILEGDAGSYRRIIDINLMSHFWTIRTFLPDMIRNRRGHILALSSMAVKYPFPFTTAYSASKTAIHSLMRTLTEELRYSNLNKFIKTTVVYPALINSETILLHKKVQILENKEVPHETSRRNEPSVIANEIVMKGILMDYEEIYLPKIETTVINILSNVPFEIRQIFWRIVIKPYDDYLKRRMEVYNQNLI